MGWFIRWARIFAVGSKGIREKTAIRTIEALQSISTQKVWNAWHYRDFGWFTEDASEP